MHGSAATNEHGERLIWLVRRRMNDRVSMAAWIDAESADSDFRDVEGWRVSLHRALEHDDSGGLLFEIETSDVGGEVLRAVSCRNVRGVGHRVGDEARGYRRRRRR